VFLNRQENIPVIISIATLKAHIEGFITNIGAAVGSAEHQLVERFHGYVHETELKAQTEAADKLRAAGWTVTPPADENAGATSAT